MPNTFEDGKRQRGPSGNLRKILVVKKKKKIIVDFVSAEPVLLFIPSRRK